LRVGVIVFLTGVRNIDTVVLVLLHPVAVRVAVVLRVARIAAGVAVRVGLGGVGRARAVVARIGDAVAVGVGRGVLCMIRTSSRSAFSEPRREYPSTSICGSLRVRWCPRIVGVGRGGDDLLAHDYPVHQHPQAHAGPRTGIGPLARPNNDPLPLEGSVTDREARPGSV
jgi:hypothetical protein